MLTDPCRANRASKMEAKVQPVNPAAAAAVAAPPTDATGVAAAVLVNGGGAGGETPSKIPKTRAAISITIPIPPGPTSEYYDSIHFLWFCSAAVLCPPHINRKVFQCQWKKKGKAKSGELIANKLI